MIDNFAIIYVKFCTALTARKMLRHTLKAKLFKNDVFVGLQPLWNGNPEVKIYAVA